MLFSIYPTFVKRVSKWHTIIEVQGEIMLKKRQEYNIRVQLSLVLDSESLMHVIVLVSQWVRPRLLHFAADPLSK